MKTFQQNSCCSIAVVVIVVAVL